MGAQGNLMFEHQSCDDLSRQTLEKELPAKTVTVAENATMSSWKRGLPAKCLI
jgi:hypothetical protein